MSNPQPLQGPSLALAVFLTAALFGGAFFAFYQSVTAGIVAEIVTAAGVWALLQFLRRPLPTGTKVFGALLIAGLTLAVRVGLLFVLRTYWA
ncbi:hypothetical protein LJY25_10245 [Hymenobacter sp. BT175]|uniref:hypothetical protein n=1 Tax=Hymenobacter translucens TaxID=2886507 RepID=UPI001D0E0B8A|nr:hypothetical protein [Hymenobacter translucens]MCC2546824.1 hypothetical protein [Hymenobacter translucens]